MSGKQKEVKDIVATQVVKPIKRSFEEELSFIRKISDCKYEIRQGFVPNMKVPAQVFVDTELDDLLLKELESSCEDKDGSKAGGGFLPALKQVANVAALPGIVKVSLAMPDVHSGYGFCIG